MSFELFPEMSLSAMVDSAIELLQAAQPDEAYWGCFSGGKDSVVIKELARLAGVRVEWHYNVTTIDPPELLRFMYRHHRDVIRDRPVKYKNVAELVAANGIPLRQNRFCCTHLKHGRNPVGRDVILGVRAAESRARANRWGEVSYFAPSKSNAICPIYYWKDEDVWEFIRGRGLPYCELYDQGYKRLGCIGCMMASVEQRKRDLERWPFAKRLWMKGISDLWARKDDEWRYRTGNFDSPKSLFDWWLSDRGTPEECDMALFSSGNE